MSEINAELLGMLEKFESAHWRGYLIVHPDHKEEINALIWTARDLIQKAKTHSDARAA